MAAHPLLYEINTRCLLTELSRQTGRVATLHDIADDTIAGWKALGFSHIWLMGVWPNGPKLRQHGLEQPSLRQRYQQVLPDWSEVDIGGSPYGISAYEPDPLLGGRRALAEFRQRLHALGLRLILDFIPNHIGLDHPWIKQRPDLLVHAKRKQPGFFQIQHNGSKLWIAHGKDPYFYPWTDTAQLDHQNPTTRREWIAELLRVSQLCDGVRCDMAMLVLNDIFSETWKHVPERTLGLQAEFWAEAITRVRRQSPDFLFLAEAYWGRETQLQRLGFDYTYDKPFLDHLGHQYTDQLQRHLHQRDVNLEKAARFLENHDEPRITSRLGRPAHQAAALLWLALPGLKLLYEGQMEGWQAHPPVQLWRRPIEPTDAGLQNFYRRILALRQSTALTGGAWRIVPSGPAWPENPTHQNFFAITWQTNPDEFELIVVNYAIHRGQCRIRLDHETSAESSWTLQDRLGTEIHHRSRAEILKDGLYLDVDAWGAQWFHVFSARRD